MTCHRLELPGGGVAIACTRGRARPAKCATCNVGRAGLLCDGCDAKLGACCAVSPRPGLDFCPACFEPVWRLWLRTLAPELAGTPSAIRVARRVAFRAFAAQHPEAFDAVPRTEASE